MDTPIEQKPSINQSLKPKQKFEGKVLKTSLQGAIVDIGEPITAFLHISQVINSAAPDEPVKNLEELLKVGDSVTVWIKRMLKDHVELTMHEPLGLDWRDIQPEMVLHGKVVRLESFGAFVEIGAERPGLVHVSELSHNYVRVPSEVVKVGDEVDVKVLEIDKRKKQIKLSMKALMDEPEPVEKEPRHPGKRGKGKQEVVEEVAGEVIPDPTFMEIAMRQAMDRAEKRKPEISSHIKRSKVSENEQDDIFERTMKGKINQD
ncbi:MAG: S1 RNA-binding domain-containing protein [Anaerolineaceae bacterium]